MTTPHTTVPTNNTEPQGYNGLASTNENGEHSLSLLIKGVHCALCIQKIESALHANDDITNARLNFSTGRLNITWSGAITNADHYVDDIEKLGYNVFPYNPETDKNTKDAENRFLLLCLGVAGFAMGNIMLLSVGLWATDEATMGEATRNLLHWISALIAVPVILFSGRPFFRSAWSALKHKQTNMDVPISLAILLASGVSLFETITHGEHVYFDSAIMLMFFLLIGRYLDFKARLNARSAATDLMQTLEGFANVIEGDKTKRVLISDLKPDMQIKLAAGEKIPIDGTILAGETTLDTSLVTGETLPREATVGDTVYAGTINQSAAITITVAKAAEDSLLADIVRLMEKAEQSQAEYVRLADKAARLYTPVVHLLAASAFLLWLFIWHAPWQDALLTAVTVLIITCPCALGLAVPVVQVLASSILMKRGILLKSGDALERLALIDTAFFDKTGTLTLGKPQLVSTHDQETLQLAASLASHSAHPLSKALIQAYDGNLLPLENIQEIAGKGLSANINGKEIKLGNLRWCEQQDMPDHNHDKAITHTALMEDGNLRAIFSFTDILKEDAYETISALKNTKINPVILSGDHKQTVQKIAKQLEITNVYAEQTPLDKNNVLQEYKNKNHQILMVGDGLNDAPVLAAADISMAPGTAIDMAQNAADIIFMGDDLKPVLSCYQIARATQKLVKQNFALAIAYNCIAVPLAFAGMVTPMIAALAMSGSSLLVIANSYRLKFRR